MGESFGIDGDGGFVGQRLGQTVGQGRLYRYCLCDRSVQILISVVQGSDGNADRQAVGIDRVRRRQQVWALLHPTSSCFSLSFLAFGLILVIPFAFRHVSGIVVSDFASSQRRRESTLSEFDWWIWISLVKTGFQMLLSKTRINIMQGEYEYWT